MQRARNRQARPAGQNDRGRGGRGGRGDRSSSYQQNAVPKINEVVPNASVSIVLKIDQPTGRQVQGTVADVLTSGNHPHGIKVRLVDGRVGRVQRMASEEEARVGSEGLSGLGRNGELDENGMVRGGGEGGRGRASRSRTTRNYTDVREDDHFEPPREGGYSLSAFLPANHPLLAQENSTAGDEGRTNFEGFEAAVEETTSTCPVCEFKGDEAAVSHHVGIHFD